MNLVNLFFIGLHRTAGLWNDYDDFWYDGHIDNDQTSPDIYPLHNYGPYIVPDECDTENPYRE